MNAADDHQPEKTGPARYRHLLPTFFLSGYECSTFLWKDQGRRDLVAETQHMEHLDEDHGFLASIGIAVAREGIPWPMVDRGGALDFSRLDPPDRQPQPPSHACRSGISATTAIRMISIRIRKILLTVFAAYAKAAAAYVVPRLHGPHFFTPSTRSPSSPLWRANGVGPRPSATAASSVFSSATPSAGPTSPRSRRPRDRPGSAHGAHRSPGERGRPARSPRPEAHRDHETFVDYLPRLGTSSQDRASGTRRFARDPRYRSASTAIPFGQMEYRPHGRMPRCGRATTASGRWANSSPMRGNRYRRPMMVGETSCLGDGRAAWLCDMVWRSLWRRCCGRASTSTACACFPRRHAGLAQWPWLNNGLCDLVPENGRLKRVPRRKYVSELHRWQKILKPRHLA